LTILSDLTYNEIVAAKTRRCGRGAKKTAEATNFGGQSHPDHPAKERRSMSTVTAVRTAPQPVIPPDDDDFDVPVGTLRPRRRLPRAPEPTDRDRLRAFLLEQNYSAIYRDQIVYSCMASDDPADMLIDLVASGHLELEDLPGARRAYGVD